MPAVCLHAKDQIERVLRRNIFLHLYAIGDLDDFFWPYTSWYGWQHDGQIQQIALLYSGTDVPTLLAFTEEPSALMPSFMRSLMRLLPRRVYAHLSLDLLPLVAEEYHVEQHGLHYKMALTQPERLRQVDASAAAALSTADLDAIKTLYAASYPGNWFDPRMLETGQYYGVWRGDRLVSVAGIHVYSGEYRVAALGNVTTLPELRGQGLGTIVCAKLCQALLETVDHIGLNVKADNLSALASYRKLGFEPIAEYEECSLHLRS
ncbi:MAG TPA: GNAT family N-acetyltransferase [Herpetosiphonaceae bacterium]